MVQYYLLSPLYYTWACSLCGSVYRNLLILILHMVLLCSYPISFIYSFIVFLIIKYESFKYNVPWFCRGFPPSLSYLEGYKSNFRLRWNTDRWEWSDHKPQLSSLLWQLDTLFLVAGSPARPHHHCEFWWLRKLLLRL